MINFWFIKLEQKKSRDIGELSQTLKIVKDFLLKKNKTCIKRRGILCGAVNSLANILGCLLCFMTIQGVYETSWSKWHI